MEIRVNQWISASEEKWLKILKLQSTSVFSGTFLPSHDQDHHGRVWINCKSLLRESSDLALPISEDLVEGLMLAAWFHDAGMATDKSSRHGELGSRMLELFIQNGTLRKPSLKQEISEAVRKHDMKEDWIYTPVQAGSSPGILNLLSIADDMDAFGITGIYRYAEIYLHREIPLRDMGNSILENAETRYQNIARSCVSLPGVLRTVKEGFETLRKFYTLYNKEISEIQDSKSELKGHVGVLNLIRKNTIEEQVRPENILDKIEGNGSGDVVHSYFKELKDELEKAHP